MVENVRVYPVGLGGPRCRIKILDFFSSIFLLYYSVFPII